MKIAITGLVNCGKTTIFNALTGLNTPTSIYVSNLDSPVKGLVKVYDERVKILSDIYKPKKTIFSTIEYSDYIGLTKGDLSHNSKVFDNIKLSDALVDVVRAFENEAIAHPDGKVDPVRDALTLETEMILSDLDLVEKRLTRMKESAKKGKKPLPDQEEQTELLDKCLQMLEDEQPLRNVEFTKEENAHLRHLQFASIKPKIVVVNISEKDLKGDYASEITEAVSNRLNISKDAVLALSGSVEMDIAQLSQSEAQEFLRELGIAEPALNRLVRHCYSLLGLISFLTVGDDEVRSWTINKGSTAVEAAGKIHSDIERGFIRAETVSYDDFISAGSMVNAKKHGSVRLEGKTYIVKDGDILNFRFNV
ncbi:GTP-dependent nucleic acid-binding protein EngD [Candidatus Magnetoovum chiemensis]|nr:GTP-dependent nucleic acid-binding protein EngD [Candidatus Magnetoovum chiemensis]